MTETMTGVLVFHSETGTEGGYYAFQDSKFMGLPAPNHWRCPRCSRVWDKNRNPETPPEVSFTYWRDMEGKVSESGARYISGFAGYAEPHDDLSEGSPSGADAEWNRQRNAIALVCYNEGHAEFEHMYPNGIWSSEGLHMLENGDRLKIWSTDKSQVFWEGEVRLIRIESFEHSVEGMWVNQMPADSMAEFRGQGGDLAWGRMFLMGLPAELTPGGSGE